MELLPLLKRPGLGGDSKFFLAGKKIKFKKLSKNDTKDVLKPLEQFNFFLFSWFPLYYTGSEGADESGKENRKEHLLFWVEVWGY